MLLTAEKIQQAIKDAHQKGLELYCERKKFTKL
jgi:hypothetical protein